MPIPGAEFLPVFSRNHVSDWRVAELELFAHIGWFVSAHILLRGGNAVSITLQLGWAQPRRERLRERDGLAGEHNPQN